MLIILSSNSIHTGQKVLQYGVKFLLECASSPLAKNPPNEWQGRRDLPGVCLHKVSSNLLSVN